MAIDLPVTSNDPATSRLAELALRLPLRILVVEDNNVNQKVLLLLLAKLGYTAAVANHGLDAFRACEKEYEVMLMDIQMPVLDGIEATRRIRTEWPQEAQPWIIAVTASTVPGTREKCLQAGMNDYLSKPLQLSALAGALERCGLRRNSPQDHPVASEPTGIDPSQLANLRELTSGDVDQLSELTELFAHNTRRELEFLKENLERGLMEHLAQRAHSLKGSSGAMGAVRMSQLCLELEERARQQDPHAATERFVELEIEFEQVMKDLRSAIKRG